MPNGDNLEDMCGICDADSSNDCAQDCSGTWGGDLVEDECEICGGDGPDCGGSCNNEFVEIWDECYNIEKTDENNYRISIAVAGFSDDDLDVTAKENLLIVRSKGQEAKDGGKYLHRGIAGRAFERKFQLADHIRVVGAELANGLLHINLIREVPEELKSRNIEIKTDGTAKLASAA